MNLKDFFLNLVFPPHCLRCNKKTVPHQVMCEECVSRIPIHTTLFCGRCRARLPSNKKICHPAFPYILAAASDYHDKNVQTLVAGLKFKYIQDAAHPLAELMARYVSVLPIKFHNYIVMPIPLGRRRERERGFNQAALVAKTFSERLGLRIVNSNLVRERDTEPQTVLKDYGLRASNVAGCFSVKNPEEVLGASIILVDDVTTSGATFFEAAVALKKAGARRIVALAIAKT